MVIINKKNQFVEEKIKDEEGNLLGILKFNPNDSNIMAKLTKIVKEMTKALDEIKKIGKVESIPEGNLDSIEELEQVSRSIDQYYKACDIENSVVASCIRDLSEIFGKETIEVFTGGTNDAYSLMPLLQFVMPYVKEARESHLEKYISKDDTDADVMK